MAATTANLKQLKEDIEGSTHQFDINKSLGLAREKLQYNQRLKALTDPKDYTEKREQAWDVMVGKVTTYFNESVAYLSAAGFDWEECKDKAKDLS